MDVGMQEGIAGSLDHDGSNDQPVPGLPRGGPGVAEFGIRVRRPRHRQRGLDGSGGRGGDNFEDLGR